MNFSDVLISRSNALIVEFERKHYHLRTRSSVVHSAVITEKKQVETKTTRRRFKTARMFECEGLRMTSVGHGFTAHLIYALQLRARTHITHRWCRQQAPSVLTGCKKCSLSFLMERDMYNSGTLFNRVLCYLYKEAKFRLIYLLFKTV